MCIKAANNYPSTIQFVPECYKNQEMCVRAVNTCCFIFASDRYKTQEMCKKAVTCFFYLILSSINIRHKKCVIKLLMVV